MKRFLIRSFVAFASLILMLSATSMADPNDGTYTSTDLGGQLLTGRASVHRTGINSGLPHVLHTQSWDGATLGTQWETRCSIENAPFGVQDNRDSTGTGTIVYTSTFTGGTFTFFAGGWPWGDGTGTLNTTTMISTVQYVNNVPVASVVNGNTSGQFSNGCALTFAIANGNGVGETSSAFPMSKPADYPEFLGADCNPAPLNQQYGTWGDVRTITMDIDCPTPSEIKSWGEIKKGLND